MKSILLTLLISRSQTLFISVFEIQLTVSKICQGLDLKSRSCDGSNYSTNCAPTTASFFIPIFLINIVKR